MEAAMPLENYDVRSEFDAVTFWVTPVLRILMRRVSANDAGVFVNGRKPVLQQAWQGSDGTIEWRDVPIIEEP